MTQPPTFIDRLLPNTADIVAARGVKRVWPAHSSIFRAEELCTGLHIVTSGLVKLYRTSSGAREQIMLLEGAGGVLTVAPVIDPGQHLMSAQTLKKTTTLFLARKDFLALYREHIDFHDAVVFELTRRIRVAIGLLETVTLRPVNARVATRLVELASAQSALDGSKAFNLLLTQDELAHVLATSRESVARGLAELRVAGIIEQRGSRIRVLQPQALFDRSQYSVSQPATPLPSFS